MQKKEGKFSREKDSYHSHWEKSSLQREHLSAKEGQAGFQTETGDSVLLQQY